MNGTLEWAAILDATAILELGRSQAIDEGKNLFHDLAAMLTALTLRWQQ